MTHPLTDSKALGREASHLIRWLGLIELCIEDALTTTMTTEEEQAIELACQIFARRAEALLASLGEQLPDLAAGLRFATVDAMRDFCTLVISSHEAQQGDRSSFIDSCDPEAEHGRYGEGGDPGPKKLVFHQGLKTELASIAALSGDSHASETGVHTSGAPILVAPALHWNYEIGILCVAGRVVGRLRPDAECQRSILDAFQYCGWPNGIENPLYNSSIELSKTLDKMNSHVMKNSGYRLANHDGGTGILLLWEGVRRYSDRRSSSQGGRR